MIETKKLSKSYGDLKALHELSMTVETGDIYGFIGPNGAGKSTTFKILSTIQQPDSGSATIGGIPITEGDQVRGLIGYMPDQFGVYDDMTVYQYLDFFAAAYFIPAKRRRTLIDDILALTDLEFKRGALVQSLSRGMQQRLGVARVLVHDPKVLILDEPASGLDPRARVELRELLRELASMGKTILISSHILSELAEICTRLGIIEQGKQVFEGSHTDLQQRLAGHVRTLVTVPPEDQEQARELLTQSPLVESLEDRPTGELAIQLAGDETLPEDIADLLVQNGCRLRGLQMAQVTLEEAFMVLTRGALA